MLEYQVLWLFEKPVMLACIPWYPICDVFGLLSSVPVAAAVFLTSRFCSLLMTSFFYSAFSLQ